MALEYSKSVSLQTKYGEFSCFSVRDKSGVEHLILKRGVITGQDCLVRIHSSCITGDVFKSIRCDCGNQLDKALKALQKWENGLVIYLQQEGRGIGLFNKINSYSLQDSGYDTVQANIELGFKKDIRQYDVACEIIDKLKPIKIRLMTNNPDKLSAILNRTKIPTVRIPLQTKINTFNRKYIETKSDKLGHLYDIS